MTSGNHMKKADLKEVPRSRHRSKPKFDIPVETTAAEPAVGWVYRAEEEEPAPPVSGPRIERSAPVSVSTQPKKVSTRNPFVMVGEGLFLVGLGTMTIVLRAASEFVVAPVRAVSMLRRR